jgi:hypothetical protein
MSDNKKDKAFLLVEIRIATEIPGIASMHKYITIRIDSSLPDCTHYWRVMQSSPLSYPTNCVLCLLTPTSLWTPPVFLLSPYSSKMPHGRNCTGWVSFSLSNAFKYLSSLHVFSWLIFFFF